MSTPLVSVIMNCYNGEQFLREAVDSIYAQTYQNWEIIFWDNVSTDNSAQIAQSYDNKLKYFLAKRFTKLGEARELAVSQAKGKYLAFLDCDDYWNNDKLQLQMPLFQDPDVGLVYSNYWIQNAKKKRIFSRGILPTGYILNDLLNSNSVGFITVIVRKSVISNRGSFFDVRYDIIHDFDLIIRISSNFKVSCIQNTLACYRYHDNNETTKGMTRYISELELWIKDNSINSKISTCKNFYRQKDVLMYLKGSELVKKGRRIQALFYFFKISFHLEKAKLFILIFVPSFIISHFK